MKKYISEVNQGECQLLRLDQMAEPGGHVEMVKLSPRQRLRLFLRRRFNASRKRKIKKSLNDLANLFSGLTNNSKTSSASVIDRTPVIFNPGDEVLVRSRDQIRATLDQWDSLKGCGFLQEMWQYCGTKQRVLKSVNRFVSEHESRVIKNVKGIYLLEGAICQGFELYGKCDRACFYWWREEWLEKIDKQVKDEAHLRVPNLLGVKGD